MEPLLKVDNLNIRFNSKQSTVHAVKGIEMNAGKTLAVVGESGSGKSVTALSMSRLLPNAPSCEVSGNIKLNGKDIYSLDDEELRNVRGNDIAYIFQEPSTSLNPVFTVGYQIAEAVKLHRSDITDVKSHCIKALKQVGIRDADKRYAAYPHEMSGGMQQRVMIAMALACEPKLLVADEPTTALDVTIQKQIMDLLIDIKNRTNMGILLITHNFGIVKDFADDVLVMYRGNVVEQGDTNKVLTNPQHPYTKALIDCIPKLNETSKRLTTIDHEHLQSQMN